MAPRSTSAVAQTRPPCLWMMRWTVARPMPGTGKDARVVQSLEGAEELVGVGHVEARAVVAHEERRAAVLLLPAEGDLRQLAARR